MFVNYATTKNYLLQPHKFLNSNQDKLDEHYYQPNKKPKPKNEKIEGVEDEKRKEI